jgi:hypothetical protein
MLKSASSCPAAAPPLVAAGNRADPELFPERAHDVTASQWTRPLHLDLLARRGELRRRLEAAVAGRA